MISQAVPSSMLGPTSALMRTREYSEETAREIDIAVRDIVKGAYDKALAILTRERAVLERGARELLQKETLVEAELAELRAALSPSR